MLVTSGADYGTFAASVFVVTNIFNAVSADVAVVAPSVTPNAVLAVSAVSTQISCAVSALLVTSFAHICTLDTAVTAVADYFGTINTGLTVVTEVSFATNAVLAGVTGAAYFGICTSGTFILTIGTYNGAILTALATVADHSAVPAVVAV